MRFTTEALFSTEYDPYCHFGIISGPLIAGIASSLADVGIGSIAGGAAGFLGADATTALAGGLAGGLEGAGFGAIQSAITGQDPLTGILTGGLTGGLVGGLGPEIGSVTGLGTTAGDVIAGGIGGIAGAEITGQNPLTGGLMGAGGGLLAGVMGGGASSTATPTAETAIGTSPVTGTGGGTSAAAQAPATTSVPAAAPSGDLTSLSSLSSAAPIDFGGGGELATPSPAGPGGMMMASQQLASSAPLGAASGLGAPASTPGGGATPSGTAGLPASPGGTQVDANSLLGNFDTGGGGDFATVGGGGNQGSGLLNWLGLGGGSSSGMTVTDINGNPVAAGSPAATDAGGGGGSSAGGFGGKLGSLLSNPGVLLGAGALGLNYLLGDQPLPAEKQLNQAAGEAASMGKGLSSYIFSGTLPPGAQEAVTNATNAATAKVKSTYASLGLGGSTQESQAVEQIKQAAAAQTYIMADQLLQQGVSYSQLSAQMYNNILQAQMQQDTALTNSIGTFAAGLAGAGIKSAATTTV